MAKIMERILTDIFKGVIYSVLFGIIGMGIGFLLGWPVLKGAYVTVLTVGCIVMVISMMFLIGTPKKRFQFIMKGKMVDGRLEKLDSEDARKDFSSSGITPAIVAVVMIVIGFMIEALMH